MKAIHFIKCLVRFPLDLLFFTFDFLRLVVHLGVKRFNPNRGCTFCFDSSETRPFPRACKSAAKYGNLWLFKLICPSIRRSSEVKEGDCATQCYYKNSKLKPYWVRYSLSGIFLLGLWGGLGWLLLVETSLVSLLRRTPDPTLLVLDDSRVAKRSLFQRVLLSHKDPAKAREFVVRARQAFAAGDYESAKLAFLNAKKFDPDSAEIRLGLGNCYYRLNKREAALMEFESAARIDPKAEAVQEKLVELHVARGDFKKAIEHGRMALKQQPKNSDVRLLLARSYLVQNKPEESKQELEAALAEGDDNPDVINMVARVYQHLQDFERAEALYRKALHNSRKHLDSLIGLAGLLKGLNKKEEILGLLQQSRDLAPGDIRVAIHFAEMVLAQGKPLDAIQQYRQIVDQYPAMVEAQARLAELLLQTGEFDEGLQLADSLMALSDPTAQATGHYILANYYFNNRLYTKALANARQVVGFSPQHVGARMLIVKSLLMKKEFDRCVVALKEVLKFDPENIEAQTVLARIHISLGNVDEGINTLAEAAEKYKESAVPNMMLGNYYYIQQQYVLAQEQFEEALNREAENPEALNSLAMTLMQQGRDLEKAFTLAVGLMERFPGHPIYADTYGWALYHKGELDEAARLMTFAVRFVPRNPEIRYHLGMIYFKKKNFELSRKYLELALAMAPEFAGIDEARRTLESLPEPEDATL